MAQLVMDEFPDYFCAMMMICWLENCSDSGPVGLGERCLQTW